MIKRLEYIVEHLGGGGWRPSGSGVPYIYEGTAINDAHRFAVANNRRHRVVIADSGAVVAEFLPGGGRADRSTEDEDGTTRDFITIAGPAPSPADPVGRRIRRAFGRAFRLVVLAVGFPFGAFVALVVITALGIAVGMEKGFDLTFAAIRRKSGASKPEPIDPEGL